MSDPKSSRPYQAKLPIGTPVRIAARDVLDRFRTERRFHNPLSVEPLAWANRETEVLALGFHDGGDVLYQLRGVPTPGMSVVWSASARVQRNDR